MSTELSTTLRWAKEFERSLVSICWWCPEYLGQVRRELDPSVHFTLPCHGLVLQAIEIAYRELGDVTWETVVQVVSEIGGFQECGEKPGLNDIFTNENHYPWGPRNPAVFVPEYIRLLKECAIIRKIDPTKPVPHYTVGWGSLRRNKLAISSQHPVATGNAHFLGHHLRLAGWPDGDDQMKLRLELERNAK
jgi:hypothetical protein